MRNVKRYLPGCRTSLPGTKYGTRRLGDQKTVETEMRDVALAALISLTKQSFADYQMQHITAAPTFVFIPYSCGFADADSRQKALEKWRAYRAATKVTGLGKEPAAK